MNIQGLSSKNDFEENNLPQGLFEMILMQIRHERLMRIKRQLVVIWLSLIITLGAAIPLFRSMEASFVESGSIQMISLIFSDFGIMMADWQNFCVAILESLPIMSIAVFLGTVLGTMYLLAFLSYNLERIATARSPLAAR